MSLLAHTFASPCLGHEPKFKVVTILLLVKQQMTFVQFMGKFTKVLSNYSKIAYVRNQRLKNDISMNVCWMNVKIMGSNYNCLYVLVKWLIM